MTVLNLVDGADKILTTPLEPFDFETEETEPLVSDLKDTMIEYHGYGLSANQVGISKRVFVFGNHNEPDDILVVFNPKIVWVSDETVVAEEGCLSFPGLFIKIKRPIEVRVRYQNQDGEVITTKLGGISARIFQHETDHLDGILYQKRANRYHLEQARRHKKRYDKIKEELGY